MSRHGRPDPKGAMIPGSQAAPKHMIHTVSQLGKTGSLWSFGKRIENKLGKADSPGPAQYSLGSHVGTGPKHIIAQRLSDHSQKSRRENPGPDRYNISEASKVRVNTPPSFSLSGRTPGSKPSEFPGPDHYRPQTAPSHTGWSLTGRHQDRASMMTPGPGAYQPAKEATLTSAPSFSMRSRTGEGYAIRNGKKGKTKACAAHQRSPGPAAYSVGDACPHKKRTPAFSMGARLSHLKSDSNPGPASYDIRSPLGSKKGY